MRLDKFLSKAIHLSRKDCKRLLQSGQISVNGHVIKDASLHINPSVDVVQNNDQILQVADGFRYLLLYKPKGFECTLKHKDHPIVLDLIHIEQYQDLRIAGRLDVDTTGALILSDDGAFLHKVTSPKRSLDKIYHLTLADAMDVNAQNEAIAALAKGVLLDGEHEKTKPAKLVFMDETHAQLTLTEGKYHQVKRMMAYFGNKVTRLHRAQIGNITLDGLQKGECRHLKPDEVAQF